MFLLMLGLLLIGGVAHAATLEIPTPHTTLSGIGVVSGWKCDAGDLTVRFDGGPPLPLVYGSERRDVLDAGACPHDRVGFVTIMNWGNLGDGQHTAVVYDDGVEFDRSTFDVVTTGEAFLRGAAGQCLVADFPAPGESARFEWNQATQHLELAEVGGAELLPTPFDGTWSIWTTSSRSRFGDACTTADLSGVLIVANESISGRIINSDVVGLVGSTGTVHGHWLDWRNTPEGIFTGSLQGRSGSGDWGTTWCLGTWTATKQ